MKKLLGALTILSFVNIANINTVACGLNDTENIKKEMDNKVLADLNFYNSKNDSLLELSIKNLKWEVAALTNITAKNLLTDEKKAKSSESKNFLTSVLKLNIKNDKFDLAAAAKIKLIIVAIRPNLEKVVNSEMRDFVVRDGVVLVQWKANNKNLGSTYTLNLKGDVTKGIVADKIPKLTLVQFDISMKPLSGFRINEDVEQLSSGELQNLLKPKDATVKELQTLVLLINKGDLKVTIIKISKSEGKFATGDTLTVKINFGDLQFSTEYTFLVPEN